MAFNTMSRLTLGIVILIAKQPCNAGACGAGNCEDKHRLCAAWAMRTPSECTANPVWMEAKCAKSCRACSAPGLPPPGVKLSDKTSQCRQNLITNDIRSYPIIINRIVPLKKTTDTNLV